MTTTGLVARSKVIRRCAIKTAVYVRTQPEPESLRDSEALEIAEKRGDVLAENVNKAD